MIKTASWSTKLPVDHCRIGISRGIPRWLPAGYRMYRALAPGPWFNSVDAEEYDHRFRTEILAPLDPRVVAADLIDLAAGRIPTLLCFERATDKTWCHRALVAEWLAEATGEAVPEVGYETRAQADHPLRPRSLFVSP